MIGTVVYNFRANDIKVDQQPIIQIKGIRIAGIEALPHGKKHHWGLLEAKRTWDMFHLLFPDIDRIEAVAMMFIPGENYGNEIQPIHLMRIDFMGYSSPTNEKCTTVTLHIVIEQK